MLSPFGEWVRAFRRNEKITLREMARTLEKSPSFLSALELGRKSVPAYFVKEISEKYSLDFKSIKNLQLAVEISRKDTRLRFKNKDGNDKKEMALLFARNFDQLSEDQIIKMRSILEEKSE